MKTPAREASQHRENSLVGHRSARCLGSCVSPSSCRTRFQYSFFQSCEETRCGVWGIKKKILCGQIFPRLVLQVLSLRCLTENTVTRKWGRELPEHPCLSLVNWLGFSRGGYVNCRMSWAKEQSPALPCFSGYCEPHTFHLQTDGSDADL